MRIITGRARGTKLLSLEGDATRPTADAVKEAVFSMIQFDIDGQNVLDLFAGSGQMALEAVSRGARGALLIDSSRDAVDIIKKNIEKTHFAEECRVINTDYKAAIRTCTGREQFGIIFLDPPYEMKNEMKDALSRIMRGNIAVPGGYIICESDSKEPFEIEGCTVKRFNKYGKAYITLLVVDNKEEE